MSKSRKSLVKPSSKAFTHQKGFCYYCGQPMWTENPQNFASKYKLTLPQTKKFQCTGEHLKAHQDGGTSSQRNIVAACKFCNQQRHRRKVAPSPDQYKKLIQQRMSRNCWHSQTPCLQ